MLKKLKICLTYEQLFDVCYLHASQKDNFVFPWSALFKILHCIFCYIFIVL